MAFVFAIAVVALALTAGVVAATLRLRGIGFLLGAYVVAAAEVVALCSRSRRSSWSGRERSSPAKCSCSAWPPLHGHAADDPAPWSRGSTSAQPLDGPARRRARSRGRAGGLAYAFVLALVAPPNNSGSLRIGSRGRPRGRSTAVCTGSPTPRSGTAAVRRDARDRARDRRRRQATRLLASDDARLAVVLGPSDWDYPLFGVQLDRELVTLPDERALDAAAAAGLTYVVFGSAWRPRGSGWELLRFESAGTLAIRK